MPQYICSESYYFRELGRRVEPNEVLRLPEAAYEHFKTSHPGLLRPAPLNTMGGPSVVRAGPEPVNPTEPEHAPQDVPSVDPPATESSPVEPAATDAAPAEPNVAPPAAGESPDADASPDAPDESDAPKKRAPRKSRATK